MVANMSSIRRAGSMSGRSDPAPLPFRLFHLDCAVLYTRYSRSRREETEEPNPLACSTLLNKSSAAAVLSLDFDEAIDFSSSHRVSFSRWTGGRYITAFSSLNAYLDFHAWLVGRGSGGLQRLIDGWKDGLGG
jgi:hypothetical protein